MLLHVILFFVDVYMDKNTDSINFNIQNQFTKRNRVK